MIKTLATFALILATLAAMAEDNFRMAVEFAGITGLHADGSNAVAWNADQVAFSQDGGLSWSAPIAPTAGGTMVNIRTAIATQQGVYVALTNGALMHSAGGNLTPVRGAKVTNLAVDGAGNAYAESMDGTTRTLPSNAVAGKGRIFAAVAGGVLVGSGTNLSLATPSGAQGINVQANVDEMPMSMKLAPLTGRGTDNILTKDGHLWEFRNNKLFHGSERPITVHCRTSSPDGHSELMTYNGQLQYLISHRAGRQVHPRTSEFPAGTTLVAIAGNRFVLATPEGVFTAAYQR